MIIQVRGTGGSGKSTAMRAVMDMMGDWQAVSVAGRKRPLYYRSCSEWPPTVVLGHYETACGGCDTVGSAKAVHDLTWEVLSAARGPGGEEPHVLMEGLVLSEDVKWSSVMRHWGRLVVVYLTTPVARCLSQIGMRRAAAGTAEPLSEAGEAKTISRAASIERSRTRLRAAGVECRRCPAVSVPTLVRALLQGDS